MPKKIKKPAKKTPKAKAKPKARTKTKKAAETLVWKRSKPGRPKKRPAGQQVGRPSSRRVSKPAVKRKRRDITELPAPLALPSLLKGEGIKAEPNGGEMFVGESKFQLGPKENAGDFQAHNIPFDYGQNRIILLVVDPKFAFVYWEVQNEKMHDAVSAIGSDAKLTLRFHEANTSRFWDISIYERVGNWYLKLGRRSIAFGSRSG
jgi:hypothetical protein